MGENERIERPHSMSDQAMQTDHSEKRFGVVAVQKGFITPDQLFKALKVQVQDDLEQGDHRLLGEILQGEGVMTWTQVGEVLQTLGVLHDVFEQ
ncbi:MAG: hypothetical protein JRF64_08610 [Deltaproteobacteria bacterium]|nr:hypothetical protein [Deltaproteobacteria bacterium]